MVAIRLLNPQNDLPLFREAWNWRYQAPKWFQESLEIFKESWDEHVIRISTELHYGIFIDENLVAVVRLTETYPHIFNIDLSAKRKTSPQILLQAGSSIRDFLFDQGVKGFYGWLPVQNRGVAWLYRSLGFFDTGEKIYKGRIHGKLAELIRYAMKNPLQT